VPDVGRVAVAVDVGRPFVLCGVGVAGADVAGLELLELLLGAEFVGLGGGGGGVSGEGKGKWGGDGRAYHDRGESKRRVVNVSDGGLGGYWF